MTRFTRPHTFAATRTPQSSKAERPMSIGLPARIVCAEGLAAQAVTRHGACAIDLARTGSLPAGAWVLAFRGVARAVIDAERARDIDATLDTLEAIASGELDGAHASLGLAHYFTAVNRHGGACRSVQERGRERAAGNGKRRAPG